MPVTSSAKKALRQNLRRRRKNLKQRRALRLAIKGYERLLLTDNKEQAQKQLSSVFKLLDRAAQNRIIAKNKAGRLKSTLAHKLK